MRFHYSGRKPADQISLLVSLESTFTFPGPSVVYYNNIE